MVIHKLLRFQCGVLIASYAVDVDVGTGGTYRKTAVAHGSSAKLVAVRDAVF